MEQATEWRAFRPAPANGSGARVGAAEAQLADDETEAAASAALAVFDRIRDLFEATALAPDPETYELFWYYATGSDAALCRAIDRLLGEEGTLSREQVLELRRAHLGAIAAGEVQELVARTQEQAGRLAEGVQSGREELAAYDAAVAREDMALASGLGAPELAELVQRLRRANARMMTANRRLEAEIRDTLLRTAELAEQLEAAETAARTDPLTGLLNRRGTLQALAGLRDDCRAAGAALSAALIDVDHFKRLNDQWGHAIGDEVLRHVAGLVSSHVKKGAGERAFVGRIGGEEFLAVLPGQALAEACATIDRARATLSRQLLRRATDGAGLGRITFSAGVAADRPDDTADSLIDRADSALYAAKRAGRDRVLPEAPRRG